ncbi:hypothetical protein CLOLEP_01533 [[Clostridium] leptum DSM 753]|uniref:Uncharacterized protein n=1 Tax=[Clostridium] leptum DSM 753 TaxID=428125 RepID=A7VSJ2_9FIRM|nr:hypothetical protein CLOLEP_01533 [[Clostridium] leptum DSM 753]
MIQIPMDKISDTEIAAKRAAVISAFLYLSVLRGKTR